MVEGSWCKELDQGRGESVMTASLRDQRGVAPEEGVGVAFGFGVEAAGFEPPVFAVVLRSLSS
jgi:hypothetical protein